MLPPDSKRVVRACSSWAWMAWHSGLVAQACGAWEVVVVERPAACVRALRHTPGCCTGTHLASNMTRGTGTEGSAMVPNGNRGSVRVTALVAIVLRLLGRERGYLPLLLLPLLRLQQR